MWGENWQSPSVEGKKGAQLITLYCDKCDKPPVHCCRVTSSRRFSPWFALVSLVSPLSSSEDRELSRWILLVGAVRGK